MLDKSLLLELAPTNPGVIRVNHKTKHCSGDSNSLRIERKADGTIYGRCFRCNDWAKIDTKIKSFTFDSGEEQEDLPPPEFEEDTSKWPSKAFLWATKFLTPADLELFELKYDPTSRRVIIPLWFDGEEVGYQARKIYDEDTGPKYITYAKSPPGFTQYMLSRPGELVIVEDVISAIKVSKVSSSLALLSTNVHPKAWSFITQFDTFYVWLDMDNPKVITSALKLLKKLRIIGDAKLIYTEKDPKFYSEDDIKRILYGT